MSYVHDTPVRAPAPGSRRRSAAPKGRQLDEGALREVRALLGDRPRRRDLLIEHLHAIQDAYGAISAAHIRALAEEMRLAQVEVYEVASFYDHFDVMREGEAPPPPITIRVCGGVSCMLRGAHALVDELRESGVDPALVRVVSAPCMGGCDRAPAARVGDREVSRADADALLTLAGLGASAVMDAGAAEAGRRARARAAGEPVPAPLHPSPHGAARAALAPQLPDWQRLDAYRAGGGHAVLEEVRSGARSPGSVIETLSGAGLRGLGGAGFPAGRKWALVRAEPGPRLMTVNADEGEPGTFKDRHYMEALPHRMLEGALIGAHVVGAERVYLYMRDEYPAAIAVLREAIGEIEAAGLAPPGYIEMRRGAGAYICGEESAMIESIEGRRGLPRHRPPFIAQSGLFGRPTLNNNVETLHWVPEILARGAEWFAGLGTPDHPGQRTYSVSGRVARPGLVHAPAGSTARELIERCGGMEERHVFRAYLPGGASGGLLPASKGDVPLDFGGELASLGGFVGSHAVVVFSHRDSMREVVLNLLDFFTHESCGQCTPCRGGTEKLAKLLRADGPLDEDAVADLEAVMRDASICGLGQAAPNPVRHWLTWFRDDA